MKKLNECKAYYQDNFVNMIAENSAEKSIYESTEKAIFETLHNTLRFIYGGEFEKLEALWKREALNEYYGKIN